MCVTNTGNGMQGCQYTEMHPAEFIQHESLSMLVPIIGNFQNNHTKIHLNHPG